MVSTEGLSAGCSRGSFIFSPLNQISMGFLALMLAMYSSAVLSGIVLLLSYTLMSRNLGEAYQQKGPKVKWAEYIPLYPRISRALLPLPHIT
jgi:hypothetical protein